MSTSGSFNTSSVGNFYFTFEWRRTGYDATQNKHYIDYTLKAHNSAGKYRTVYLKKLVINGNQVFYQSGTKGSGHSYYNDNIVTNGSITIDSYNSAGNGNISVSFEAGVGSYPNANCSGSGSWELDRIPRYFTGWSVSQKSNALNSVVIQWNTNERRDWTGWSFQMGIPDSNKSYTGSATYSEWVAGDGRSGTFEIRGLAPNTSTLVTIAMKRADSQLYSYQNITITTKGIATITSPNSNFNVNSDNSLTVKCNNPSGKQIAYFLDCPSGTRRLTSDKTNNTSYTWSASQILSMLQYFKKSNSSSIKVGLITYGDTEYYSEKIGTLNVVNSNPTFNNFTYEDTDSNCIKLTGGNKKIIKGFSDVKIIISTANKAIAKNYADISKYQVVIGSQQKDISYSKDNSVSTIVSNVLSNIFNVYAIDSRGNSTVKQISPSEYLDYNNIGIKNASISRTGGVGTETTLKFNGSFWNHSFGAMNNAIIDCHYEYKTTYSDKWINGGKITPSISGNNFNFTGTIKGDIGANGFSATNSFSVRVIIKDRLTTATYDLTLGSGTPAIAMYKNGIAINGMFDTSLEPGLQVNGKLYLNGKEIKN